MWIYARGEQAVRAGDIAKVKAAVDTLKATHSDLKALKDFRTEGQAMVEVARLVLTGRAAMMEQRWRDAETAYRTAAEIQEARLAWTADPPAWWYPVRRSLAAALLAEGRTEQAEVEASAAMKRWYYDPMALRILADCERKAGRPGEAEKNLTFARSNWAGDVEGVPLSQV
jgi:hypothetical protein